MEKKHEIDNTLPFLDVLIRQVDNKLSFSVFRKSTTTDRYITQDSFCSHQNKIAAFHSAVYRLCKLPLSVIDFKAEYDRIVQIADTNGFDKALIDNLIQKHSNNIRKLQLSTLFAQNKTIAAETQRTAVVQYAPEIFNHLSKSFKKANIKLVYSNNNKLKTALGTTKDTIPIEHRSGVYEISCSDCDAKYIGQTRRALHTRVSEHLRSIKNREVQKAIPAHIFNVNNSHKHNINSLEENVKLIKTVNKSRKLDDYESLYISRTKNLINFESGPIESPLFKFV